LEKQTNKKNIGVEKMKMIETIDLFPRGSKTWPFYNCKHIFFRFYFDKFFNKLFFKCVKCGKVKHKEKGKWKYL